jgi:pyridoxal phosphate enzyme (YggS family)
MTDAELTSLLQDRISSVRSRIAAACARVNRDPAGVSLVAVTKTVSPRVAALLPGLGVADLGENRPQALWQKAAAIPQARWHLVGHLQRNKVEKTVPLVSLIHSVDSVRLLAAVGRQVPILLEVNCSREAAKGGFAPADLPGVADQIRSLKAANVEGLMTMAAYDIAPDAARPAFAELRALREDLRALTGLHLPHLSMGMSNDFEVAVEEGATLVRVGTTLFHGLENE